GQFCGLEIRPFPRFSTSTSAELSALCRTKCQVGSGAVWDDASAFLATMPPHSARVSMAANEVLARVADVASSDLLDFIVELAHRLPLRYRCHRDRHGVRQGRPADAEACHRRLPTSSEGL